MSWFRENRLFIYIFVIALVIRLVFWPGFHEVWWDAAVYIGMGKYLFSLGNAGLWEHIRPLFWPFVMGFLWFIKLSPVFFGRLLEILLSMGAIFLFYMLAEHYFSKKAAVIATILFSFSSIFLQFTFHLYTEIPLMFLVLLSLLFFEKEYYFIAGLLIGLGFLTKFPAAMFIFPLLLILLIRIEFKNLSRLLLGFGIPVILFFIFNFFMYSNPLLPLIDARRLIAQVMGCNFFRKYDWWFYFAALFKENWFHLFALPGLWLFLKKYRFKQLLPALFLLFPLIYFSQFSCRDYRYLFFFLPFVCMFSGSGIVFVSEKFFKTKKRIFIAVLLIVLCFSVFKGAEFVLTNEMPVNPEFNENYAKFLEDKSPVGEVWVANPIVSLYSDSLLKKIYYTDFDSDASTLFYHYLKSNNHKIQYVLLDNCGGGIMCYPTNEKCKSDKNKTIEYLNDNFNLAFEENYGLCYYRVYENGLF